MATRDVEMVKLSGPEATEAEQAMSEIISYLAIEAGGTIKLPHKTVLLDKICHHFLHIMPQPDGTCLVTMIRDERDCWCVPARSD